VLVRHFANLSVRPVDIETRGLSGIQAVDLAQARTFGGAIKFVAHAKWTRDGVEAFVGPTFVPAGDRLAAVDGVENAIRLHGDGSPALFYAGPGAGPAVTAATILDDAVECAGRTPARSTRRTPAASVPCTAPASAWFIRLNGPRLPHGSDIADLLGSYGIWPRRVSDVVATGGHEVCYLLTWPAPRATIERALTAITVAADCEAFRIRSLEQ
jgi:hypothetical protein